MNITFTGINNVKMAVSKVHEKFGSYPTVTGEIKQGDIQSREYKLWFKLLNDKHKADFDDFLDCLSKSQTGFTKTYFPGEPNKIELLVKNNFVKDDIIDTTFSSFKINGESINFSRASLVLFTKLAEITRRISSMTNLSPNQRKCAQIINQSIANEAEKLIEII